MNRGKGVTRRCARQCSLVQDQGRRIFTWLFIFQAEHTPKRRRFPPPPPSNGSHGFLLIHPYFFFLFLCGHWSQWYRVTFSIYFFPEPGTDHCDVFIFIFFHIRFFKAAVDSSFSFFNVYFLNRYFIQWMTCEGLIEEKKKGAL